MTVKGITHSNLNEPFIIVLRYQLHTQGDAMKPSFKLSNVSYNSYLLITNFHRVQLLYLTSMGVILITKHRITRRRLQYANCIVYQYSYYYHIRIPFTVSKRMQLVNKKVVKKHHNFIQILLRIQVKIENSPILIDCLIAYASSCRP